MVDRGVNPFITSSSGMTQFEYFQLGAKLSNLPTQKSVYFKTQPFADKFENKVDFPSPWYYETGVFGFFSSKVGQGTSGTTLRGVWFGCEAKFEFVEIETDNSARKKPSEKISEIQSIPINEASNQVEFFAH